MIKPQMPNLPGAGAVADTLDFVKNLWGSMSVPGLSLPSMATPSMSVEELDKKIADLKAVESWLNLNLSMLRGTIQTLEVQRGTIATLKSMGAALATAVKQPGANEKSVLAAAPYASAFFSQPPADAPAPVAKPPAEAAAPPAKEAASAPDATVGLANPGLWWNLLQDQFKAAVTSATAPKPAAAPAAKAAPKAAAKASAKPAAKAPARKRAPAKQKAS